MTNKRQYLILISLGLILMFLGFVLSHFNIISELSGLVFLNGGIVLSVVSILKFNRFGAGVTQDEMTRNFSSQSLAYSWLITFVAVNIMFWIDYLGVYKFNAQSIFTIIIFLMLFSSAIIKKFIFKI
ncbi:MAG: hypothetical protein GF332_00905 [Candidatus Moranbacteria bacterium]|nr:hypothetical protein [Candidatus Moranbacteria bacterium]